VLPKLLLPQHDRTADESARNPPETAMKPTAAEIENGIPPRARIATPPVRARGTVVAYADRMLARFFHELVPSPLRKRASQAEGRAARSTELLPTPMVGTHPSTIHPINWERERQAELQRQRIERLLREADVL
jgi:hypothetical protein